MWPRADAANAVQCGHNQTPRGGPRMERIRTGASAQPSDRPDTYYVQSRPEVADLVPSKCRRVLEVGCGAGELGRLLKQRGHYVAGVELVPEAAEAARRH